MSTIYELVGVTTDQDTLKIKDKVYDVPEVGGVSFELNDDGSALLILKHVQSAELDDAAIAAAVRAAGDYDVDGRRPSVQTEERDVRRRTPETPRD